MNTCTEIFASPYFQRPSAMNNDRFLNNDCPHLKMLKPMTELTSIHATSHTTSLITSQCIQSLYLNLVAVPLLWAYLGNRLVDFLYFCACQLI